MIEFVNVSTPWGKSQGGQLLAPHIKSYYCAGHGGIKVMARLNQTIPFALRRHDGWYEEDIDACIVWYYHYDAIEAYMRPRDMPGWRVSAEAYFSEFTRAYFKEQLERYFIAESIHCFGALYTPEQLDAYGRATLQERLARLRHYDVTHPVRVGDRIIFDVSLRFTGWPDTYRHFIYQGGNRFMREDGGGLCRIRLWCDYAHRVEKKECFKRV